VNQGRLSNLEDIEKDLLLLPTRESVLYAEYYSNPSGTQWEIQKTGYNLPEQESLLRNPVIFPVHLNKMSQQTVYIKYSGFYLFFTGEVFFKF